MTAGELHDALARLGADLMVRALGALERGTLAAHAAAGRGRHLRGQDRQGRDAHRLGASRGRRCTTNPRAVAVSRRVVRACRRQPARIKVLRTTRGEGSGAPGTVLDDRLTIACGEGAVRLLEVQRAGKQPMKAEEFLRGDEDRARNARCRDHPVRSAQDDAAGDPGQFSIAAFAGACRSRSGRAAARSTAISLLALVAEDGWRSAVTWRFRGSRCSTIDGRIASRGRARAGCGHARLRQRRGIGGALIREGHRLLRRARRPARLRAGRSRTTTPASASIPMLAAAVRVESTRARISWRCASRKRAETRGKVRYPAAFDGLG